MNSLDEITLADVARAMQRYRPLVLVALALFLAIAVLPPVDLPEATFASGGGRVSRAARASGTTPAGSAPAGSAAGGPLGGGVPGPLVSTSGPSPATGAAAGGAASVPTVDRVFAHVSEPGAPRAIAVTASGQVWVGTDNGDGRGSDGAPKLFRYGPSGTLDATYQPAAIQRGITAIVASDAGPVHVLARVPAEVFVLEPSTGETRPYARIPDVHPCVPPIITSACGADLVDQPPLPTAMAFDAAGNLFVADAGQGAIWQIPTGGGDAQQWYAAVGWATPEGEAGPAGLAVDAAGNLVVVIAATLLDDSGAVFRLERTDDGAFAKATELATTGAGTQPGALALAASGRLYIPLRSAGHVLVMNPDGTAAGQLPTAGTIDSPAGVAFIGSDLLVTSQDPGNASGGLVVRLPVGEVGGTISTGPR